jgi:hypothetical protein
MPLNHLANPHQCWGYGVSQGRLITIILGAARARIYWATVAFYKVKVRWNRVFAPFGALALWRLLIAASLQFIGNP